MVKVKVEWICSDHVVYLPDEDVLRQLLEVNDLLDRLAKKKAAKLLEAEGVGKDVSNAKGDRVVDYIFSSVAHSGAAEFVSMVECSGVRAASRIWARDTIRLLDEVVSVIDGGGVASFDIDAIAEGLGAGDYAVAAVADLVRFIAALEEEVNGMLEESLFAMVMNTEILPECVAHADYSRLWERFDGQGGLYYWNWSKLEGKLDYQRNPCVLDELVGESDPRDYLSDNWRFCMATYEVAAFCKALTDALVEAVG